MNSLKSISHTCSDLTLLYLHEESSGRIGLQIYPSNLASQLQKRRPGLAGEPFIDAVPGMGNPPAWRVDPLAQVKILGDPYCGSFSQGLTMRNSPSVDRFKFFDQQVEKKDGHTLILTLLKDDQGHRIQHHLSWHEGDQAVQIQTIFINQSTKPVTLEMLGSFSLGGLSPFDSADSSERLWLHRFRSSWSSEGRLETQLIEDLHLERSWHGGGMFCERFGQVGSMPVRHWFPFVAIEDRISNVTWGAQLAWAGSWQMEVFRQHDDICLSGGLADREFGHWTKTLKAGESFSTPPAFLSCAEGSLDEVCDRLTALQHRAANTHPAVERDLPVIFNEWCTTWGDPTQEKLLAVASRLKDSPVKYLVIDAGWYKETGSNNFFYSQGDWIPNQDLFPSGLEGTAEAIRKEGFIPGLWFEFETCGQYSTAFSLVDHLVKRDGLPVTCMGRRFWDMTDPFVIAYLHEKVIGLLKKCNFGYLKVDYNETIGLGMDHPDSLGEGLRLQIEGVHRFFERIRIELPDLVIENCSSGGHRLEPSMLARSAMSSFSDAHELVEIPIIAANLHRLLLPRQSQIWAVLHRNDSDQRLAYSLAATFLGRMCLSGDIAELTPEQMEIVRKAWTLYQQAAPVIKYGTSRRFGKISPSWRHPQGWQAVRRVSINGNRILIVAHSFADSPGKIEVPLPQGPWKVAGEFPSPAVKLHDSHLSCPLPADFCGQVILLEKQGDLPTLRSK